MDILSAIGGVFGFAVFNPWKDHLDEQDYVKNAKKPRPLSLFATYTTVAIAVAKNGLVFQKPQLEPVENLKITTAITCG